jgi:hypothetical protein
MDNVSAKRYILDPVRFIPPFLLNRLARMGPVLGVCSEDGLVVIDGCKMAFRGEAPAPGSQITIFLSGNGIVAALTEDLERERTQRKAEQEAAAARSRAIEQEAANARRERAIAANAKLTIPVEWNVAYRVVLSGLLARSNGDGRYRSTVNHILLAAPLRHGRLSRNAGDMLCSASPRSFDIKVYTADDGDRYIPAVDCAACLATAKRHGWVIE